MYKGVRRHGSVSVRAVLRMVFPVSGAVIAIYGIMQYPRDAPRAELEVMQRLMHAEATYMLDLAGGGWEVRRRYVSNVTVRKGNVLTLNDLAALRGLAKLKDLSVYNTPVADDVLRNVCEIRSLQELSLSTKKEYFRMDATEMHEADQDVPKAMFSNGAFARLDELKHLRSLELWGVVITDEQIKYIAGLKDLEKLMLVRSLVSVRGLRTLGKLRHLTSLSVGIVEDKDAATKELQRELPGCDIFVYQWPSGDKDEHD